VLSLVLHSALMFTLRHLRPFAGPLRHERHDLVYIYLTQPYKPAVIAQVAVQPSSPARPLPHRRARKHPGRAPKPHPMLKPELALAPSPSKTASSPVPAQPQVRPSAATVRATGINASGDGGNAGGGVPSSVRDQPVPISRVAHPPVLLLRALPRYPTEARLRGIEGRVLLRAIIDRTGAIEDDISVVESVAILDAAAIEALRKWRFKPGSDRDGHPLRVLVEVPLHFSLH
jgi:protein TonB